MALSKRDQEKIDDAVAARCFDALAYGGFEVGDDIEVDIRFGHEGPDSWTRCEATVEQRHLDQANAWLQEYVDHVRPNPEGR
jgi:hypothetical protein